MKVSNGLKFICGLASLVFLLIGCSNESGKTAYLAIENQFIMEDEVMLYLLQTYNEFEAYGGDEVWDITDFDGGKSAGDVAKQGALDNLIMTRVLVKKGEEQNLTLETEEKEAVLNDAQSYFEALPLHFVERYEITLDLVNQVLLDNKLAMKIETLTKENYEVTDVALGGEMVKNTEYTWLMEQISRGVEQILTSYTIEHLVVYTHEVAEDSQWYELDEEAQKEARIRIEEAYELSLNEDDLKGLVLKYSEEEQLKEDAVSKKITKLQTPERLFEVIKLLEIGEVSGIVEGDYGYHLFKLLEKTAPTDEEIDKFEASFAKWEEILIYDAKEVIIDEGFKRLYDKWLDETEVEILENWSELDILSAVKLEEEQ